MSTTDPTWNRNVLLWKKKIYLSLTLVPFSFLFRYCEEFPGRHEFDSLSTSLAGLGIGLLATAAVSLAPHVADIPLAGAQVIRQAFRIGVLVDEISANLQPRDLTDTGTPDSWAYVLPNVTAAAVQRELDTIYAQEVGYLPTYTQHRQHVC